MASGVPSNKFRICSNTSDNNYFARMKIDGKIIRKSLGTDTFITAKLPLWRRGDRSNGNYNAARADCHNSMENS
jgi:hypothetical protein